jgi:tetratricopeptide (TPR) repeat protein
LTILLALSAAAAWLPPTWLWGLNHAAWLPLWVRFVLPVAGLILIWSPAGTRLGTGLTSRLGPLLLDRPLIAYGVLPIVGAVSFWLLRDATHMLGDGQTLAVMIAGDNLFHGFDFMTFHLIARAYQISGADGEGAAIQVAAVLSCLSGAGYLAVAAWSARRLSEEAAARILLYGLLVFGAALQIFFGYMEVYAPLAVFLLLFLTSFILYLEGKGSLLAASAAWAVALFFHLNALFLAPLLLAVLIRPPAHESARFGRRLLAMVWPPLVALAVAGTIFAFSGYDLARMREDFGHVGSGSGILVSLSGEDGLLTWRHLKDTLNLLLLLAPVPLVLLITTKRNNGPALPYLFGGAAWLIILLVVVHLKLGAVRDWDLFAPHASLLVLAGWYALAGRRDHGPVAPALVGGLMGVAVILAVPWFAINANEARSLNRLENVAADLAPYPRGLLHEQFAYHHQLAGNQAEVIRHYRKCGEVCPNHPRFHAIYGTYMLNLGDAGEAAAAYDRSVAADSSYVYGLKMAALARVLNQEYAAALPPARRLAELGGQDAEAAAAHGTAAEQTGLTDEAIEAFHRAAALDPTHLDLLERAAGLQLYQRNYPGAEEDFRRILNLEPGRDSASLGLADAIWQDFVAAPGSRPTGETRSRLDEAAKLIDRMIAAHRRQGKDAAGLSAWRQQVASAQAEITDR